MAEVNLLTQLYNDFLVILEQTVIKYNVLAEKNETLESKRNADAYLNAYLMKDKFGTYIKFDKEVIADVFDLDMTFDFDEIVKYEEDNSLIPFKLRDTFLHKQRQFILDHYVEKNNYYRMLNGQPDYEEDGSEFIFVDDNTAIQYNIDPTIPVHLLDEVKISLLQTIGYMDELISQHPEKKYLRFLGKNQIDIVTARTAKNFAVLRIPYDVSDTLWDRFAFIYEQCREYFMTCIYITEMRNTIDYYDNFMAMMVMVMTIQQVIARVIKDTIERNFFDDYCVRTLFSVYGVPYYTYMDSGVKRQIVQDLNILVLNKGTNRVLYDIASILGYDRLKIYKYYLMKVQRFDMDGSPTLIYKNEKDPVTGELVPDYEQMFDIYFQAVEYSDLDTYRALLDPTNKKSYEEITLGDPFWVEDDALYQEIYNSEYNFVETKYLGVSISYRLSRILFENVYLMKMIFEKKEEIPKIILALPKVSPFMEVNLFDTICLLCALTCKQNHLKGEILARPSAILHVLGFNFNLDFEKIKQDILADPLLDNTMTKFFKDSSTYTIEGINRLYNNIMELYDFLVEKLSTCQDVETYDAYMKFYMSLYYTDENRSMFGIGVDDEGNPMYADTFFQYLEYANPDLADLVNELEDDQYNEIINHICQKVVAIIPKLRYFGIMAGRSETMEKMLVDLICFFKSYTTDMVGLNTLFIFDMKPELILRLIDELSIHKTIQPEDHLDLSYADHLRFTSTVRYRDRFPLWDRIKNIATYIHLFDRLHFWDICKFYSKFMVDGGSIQLYDILNLIMTQIFTNENLKFSDSILSSTSFSILDDRIPFRDFLKICFRVSMETDFPLYDVVEIVNKLIYFDKSSKLTDSCRWELRLYREEFLKYYESIADIHKVAMFEEAASVFFDLMHNSVKFRTPDNFALKDSCEISYSE